MICTGCGREANPIHMCDLEEGELCGECFEQTDCGQGLHEEGCETVVFEGNETEGQEG